MHAAVEEWIKLDIRGPVLANYDFFDIRQIEMYQTEATLFHFAWIFKYKLDKISSVTSIEALIFFNDIDSGYAKLNQLTKGRFNSADQPYRSRSF